MLEAARRIAGRRKLVLLISDFLIPKTQIEEIFAALSAHDIVPIHLMDSTHITRLPPWGLMALRDAETGRRRLVVMRPSLKRAWQRAADTRRADLRSIAMRYGRAPFEITDAIDWDRLGSYLAGGGA